MTVHDWKRKGTAKFLGGGGFPVSRVCAFNAFVIALDTVELVQGFIITKIPFLNLRST